MGLQIDYVADWPGRLEGRLYEQFKGQPNLTIYARKVLGRQAQDLEDSGQSLLTITSIEDSEGVNLDVIGRRVGQPRGGVDDPTYRPYLRARIAANRSAGRTSDIYTVFNVLYGSPVSQIIIPGRLAAFVERINTPLTPEQALVGVVFLHDSKDAGIRAILEWQEDVDAQMFYTAQATTIRVNTVNGDLTLGTRETVGFPPSGQLTLDPGLGNAETVTYTGIASGVSFTIQAPGVQNVHTVGAAVELVGDQGLGFGDSGNPATGGKFEGAASAS